MKKRQQKLLLSEVNMRFFLKKVLNVYPAWRQNVLSLWEMEHTSQFLKKDLISLAALQISYRM